MAAMRERNAISPVDRAEDPCASYITRNDDDDDNGDKINTTY